MQLQKSIMHARQPSACQVYFYTYITLSIMSSYIFPPWANNSLIDFDLRYNITVTDAVILRIICEMVEHKIGTITIPKFDNLK